MCKDIAAMLVCIALSQSHWLVHEADVTIVTEHFRSKRDNSKVMWSGKEMNGLGTDYNK